MRLAIVNLTGGGISWGYKKYLENVLPRFSASADIEAILCAAPENLNMSAWFTEMPRVSFVNCRPFSILGLRDPELLSQLDQFRPDVVFVPMERYFRYRDIPTVCMPQNMLPMSGIAHPNIFEKLRNLIQRNVAYRAVRRADHVIAISGFVSNFLHKEWLIPSEKIGLAYFGVNPPATGTEKPPKSVPSEWAGQFIFTAGSIEVYRGLEDILLSVAELKKAGVNLKAVIGGSPRPSMRTYHKKMLKLTRQLSLEQNICWAGLLTGDEMAWCYKNSRAYVMTSRIEACPNTALEAMSHGNLIVSSSAPPMPEFFGTAALYYEAGDVKALSEALRTAFSASPEQQERLSREASLRAQEFSWASTVTKTVAELQKALHR